MNGLEVRNKDSIRVFVELTTPINGNTDPTLVEDNLIFTLESGVQQKVNLNAYSWDAELLKNVEITTDKTIRSTKPIVIQGSLKVAEGATLTVAAGTTLYFSNKAGIDVYGTLKTVGTPDAWVTLRGDRLDLDVRLPALRPCERTNGKESIFTSPAMTTRWPTPICIRHTMVWSATHPTFREPH